MADIISLRDVWIRYRKGYDYVLRGVSFDIREGERVGLVGSSGCGKSTICHLVKGLVPWVEDVDEFKGDVLVDGVRVGGVLPGDMVGLVFQDLGRMLFRTTVELEASFGLEGRGLERAEIERRVFYYLRAVGLYGLRKRSVYELSVGQKRLLALVSVLVMEPRVLILDDVFIDLDPIWRCRVFELVDFMNREFDTTVIITGKNLEGVVEHVDRLIVLDKGVVVLDEKPIELRDLDFFINKGLRVPQVAEFFYKIGQSGPYPVSVAGALSRFGTNVSLGERASIMNKKSGARKSSNPIIMLSNVWHSYDKRDFVLKDINLQISGGEIVAVIGSNGSGKSTLLMIMGGLLKPRRGDVYFCVNASNKKGYIGYVFQDPGEQLLFTTVKKMLLFALEGLNISRQKKEERIRYVMEMLGILTLANEDIDNLTISDRKRVALAMALVKDPDIVIIDEPMIGLMHSEIKRIMNFLRVRCTGREGILIFSTNEMWLTAEYATRVIVLRDGRIFMDGPPEVIFSHFDTLKELNLATPQITFFSLRTFGKCFLSVDEAVNYFRRVGV